MAESTVVPTFGKPWTTLAPGLSQPMLDSISSLGYENMTPVQEATIPAFTRNQDVVVEAATGSGKTLSFVIPILELLRNRPIQLTHKEIAAIIISPTRELAKQIYDVLQKMLSLTGSNYRAHLVIGGSSSATNTADEIQQLKELGPDILVGTPGRLEDIVCGRMRQSKKKNSLQGGRRGLPSVSANRLEMLVLDEADRLLDMGFESSLTALFNVLPKQRRTGLFSATMSDALDQLVRTGLRNPVRVQVQVHNTQKSGEQKIPSTLSIQYLVCPPDRKLSQILRTLQSQRAQKYIIYFSTCAAVDYFYRLLRRLLTPNDTIVPGGKRGVREEKQQLRKYFQADFPISVYSLHGQMVQTKRQATYDSFASITDSAGILLCTDVASRGLDIPDVDSVIQWDPPTDPKSFAHRCGRTARAGRKGKAWVFLNPGAEETYVEFMAIRKVPMTQADYLWQDNQGTVTTEKPEGVVIESSSSGEEEEEEEEEEGKKMTNAILMAKYPQDSQSDKLLDYLRGLVATDRDIYEKGKLAFVSFIQSYAKHITTFIFRQKELPIIEVAKGFALLHLPSMPELRGRPTGRFQKYPVDTDQIPFLDGKREARRLEKLKQQPKVTKQLVKEKEKRKHTDSWSDVKEAKERAKERKLKRIKRRDAQSSANEARLMEEISDPRIKEAMARDPLLAKQMLNKRDKSLKDIVVKQPPVKTKMTLEDIVEDARQQQRKRKRKQKDADSSSSGEEEEDSWEALAQREAMRKKILAAQKKRKPKFTFNPGFSDEEDQ